MDCYMNNIGDMPYEKYFYDHYKKFDNNHDSVVIVFNKKMIF